MKTFSKVLIVFVATMAFSIQFANAESQAINGIEESGGYEANLIGLLKDGLKSHIYPHNYSNEKIEPAAPIIDKFIDKFKRHEMVLKNVVYRNDHKTIRITWSDKGDNFVVKQTYATASDSILENSKFADKENPADTKIMYRNSEKEEYKYIQLIMMSNGSGAPIKALDEKPSEERCNFCHILARSDVSPNGVFFKRYQADGNGIQAKGKVNNFFDIAGFSKINLDANIPKDLPVMSEPFFYRIAKMDDATNPSTFSENSRVVRTLIEIPHLMEVFATDNQKSICIGIDFGASSNHGFGRNDYICADNNKKMLHIKFTNTQLYGSKEPRLLSEPYIDFKKLAVIK
jgi:hypothetical protein